MKYLVTFNSKMLYQWNIFTFNGKMLYQWNIFTFNGKMLFGIKYEDSI